MTICFFNDWNHQLALDIPTHHNDVYIIEFASIDEFAIRPFRAMNVSGKKQTGHLFVFLFGKKRHFVPPMEVWDQALILSPLGSHSGVCTTSASTCSPKNSILSFVPTFVHSIGK